MSEIKIPKHRKREKNNTREKRQFNVTINTFSLACCRLSEDGREPFNVLLACAKTIITSGVSYSLISLRFCLFLPSTQAIITNENNFPCIFGSPECKSFLIQITSTVCADCGWDGDDKNPKRKHFSGIFINSSSSNVVATENKLKKVHHQSVQKISSSSVGRLSWSKWLEDEDSVSENIIQMF